MMFASDLVERVAHRVEKVPVGRNDGTVELEFDHRLRPADGGGLRQCILNQQFLLRIEQAELLHVPKWEQVVNRFYCSLGCGAGFNIP
jgi:hypothetical protein